MGLGEESETEGGRQMCPPLHITQHHQMDLKKVKLAFSPGQSPKFPISKLNFPSIFPSCLWVDSGGVLTPFHRRLPTETTSTAAPLCSCWGAGATQSRTHPGQTPSSRSCKQAGDRGAVPKREPGGAAR